MLAIETSGLTKYYGRTPGVIHLDLEIIAGEVFGFIGPNGAGKTTTIRSMLGLIRPTAGTVNLLGQPMTTKAGEVLREVGYLPAEPRYYPEMTGRALLDYAASFHRGIDRNWVAELIERLKFDPSRRIREYSHGNKKKLGIVQALLHRPRLVILDEPTSGLDPLIRWELFQLLADLNRQGMTIFFSTHVLEEVERVCDRVALIKEGRLLQLSPVDRLPGRNLKLVTMRMASGEAPSPCTGWSTPVPVDGKPGYFRVTVQAPVNEITGRLSQLDLDYLKITDPSLEDIFFTLYESDGQGGKADDPA